MGVVHNIITSEWFSTMQGEIGIVAVKKPGGWKAYIGICRHPHDKMDDQMIADIGTPLVERFAKVWFPKIEGDYV